MSNGESYFISSPWVIVPILVGMERSRRVAISIRIGFLYFFVCVDTDVDGGIFDTFSAGEGLHFMTKFREDLFDCRLPTSRKSR